MDSLDKKIISLFPGRIVRKDLTALMKRGANVPTFVLEYLLGMYCATDDEDAITVGLNKIRKILSENYVRPDEAQKVLSLLRHNGSHTVIDMITVHLNIKTNQYEAEFSNLGLKSVPIADEYPEKYDRLLIGGIWCIVQLDYDFIEEDKKGSPISIRRLTPIQMPHVDMDEYREGRKAFTKEEWMDVLLLL